VVKIGADACLCVPMRADAVDAVISHTVMPEIVQSLLVRPVACMKEIIRLE